MSDLFWLTDEQIQRLRPFFLKSHGRPRIDDRRVLSGIAERLWPASLSFLVTAGQGSDYTGAAALLDDMLKTQWLLGDCGDDADRFRDALQAQTVQPCIPGRRSRNEPVKYDKRRYRRRSRIEIVFGRLNDGRRVATRYDRCPTERCW